MGEKRWPPMWVISQVAVPPAACRSAASGRPRSAQQRSRRPLVQTKTGGSPWYGLRRGRRRSLRCSPRPSAARSRPTRSAGSRTSVARIHVPPGAVWAARTRRLAGRRAPTERRTPAGRRTSACLPGRPDERDAHAGALGALLQRAADLGVEVALGQRLVPPRPGLLDEQPGRGDGRGPGERFGQLSRGGRARTHEGEPNRSSTPRPAGPVRPGDPSAPRAPRGSRDSRGGAAARRVRPHPPPCR